ncbi:MAG: MFS transporter [Verrucomicrobiaceae bacterium]|nr:MFS transporter [Verrucomicrobiaceae bacterium]
MTAIRRQFFLSYAVIGSVMPLMTVFLKEQGGFSYLQIGLAQSLMSVPMLCSPALITLLADRNLDARVILAAAFTCSATVLSLIFFSTSITLTLTLFVFHGLAFVAMLPLQDGYFFSLAEKHRKLGRPVPEYPLVRIWGAVGFIVPSLILFYPLSRGAEPRMILPCAILFCLFSLANSFTLTPVPRLAPAGTRRLPSRQALHAIFGPNARWLAIGLFFAFFAVSTYYAFIGNYLDEVIGIPRRHIGLIINLGVVLELVCTLLMPWLQRKIHLKGVMVLGLSCMVARMLLLACFPTPFVAVIAQLGHGFEILALYIGPIMFLNRLAGDEFRNSIQGVFTMAVGGTARVIGGVSAGFMVTWFGLRGCLFLGAGMSTCALLIIAFLFSRIPPREDLEEKTVSPVSLP